MPGPPATSSPSAAAAWATTPPARRTQGERRAATRRALLDATAICLIEHGYAGTTTTAVCHRAGLSQGALFKHFATKQDLLTAAAEHLYDQLTTRFLDRFRRLERQSPTEDADPGARVDRAVALLWKVFQSEEFAASLELELAARTDDSLRADLQRVVTRQGDRIRELAWALFPDAPVGERTEQAVDVVLELMLGMAVSRIVDPAPAHYRRVLDHAAAVARDALVPPAASHPPLADPDPEPARTAP